MLKYPHMAAPPFLTLFFKLKWRVANNHLAELRRLVEKGDARGMEDFFARSKEKRDAIQ